jgi:hypothetical protein
MMDMPLIEGEKTGGLSILSYKLETSADGATWTTLCGDPVDYTLSYFVHQDLTTNTGWYYRYSVRTAVGWSLPSPVSHSMVGT